MDDNPHIPSILHKTQFSANDRYILARAARHVPQKVESGSPTNGCKPFFNQSQLHHYQIKESFKHASEQSTTSQPKTRLPLNMIVSKTATRNISREDNADRLVEFDTSNIRKLKVPVPSWKEKEGNQRRLQSAMLYNKRKIEEIQAMKAKLKYPRYDQGYLQRPRHYNAKLMLSESISVPEDKSPEGRCPRIINSTNFRTLETLTEDPLPNDLKKNQSVFRDASNEGDNSFSSSTPTEKALSKEKAFVFNPVILPAKSSFGSAMKLLEHYYPPHVDSPGDSTTSSTSSGVTVAEETLRLTYYTGRYRMPVKKPTHTRSDHFTRPEEDEWVPCSCQLDFLNCCEE